MREVEWRWLRARGFSRSLSGLARDVEEDRTGEQTLAEGSMGVRAQGGAPEAIEGHWGASAGLGVSEVGSRAHRALL